MSAGTAGPTSAIVSLQKLDGNLVVTAIGSHGHADVKLGEINGSVSVTASESASVTAGFIHGSCRVTATGSDPGKAAALLAPLDHVQGTSGDKGPMTTATAPVRVVVTENKALAVVRALFSVVLRRFEAACAIDDQIWNNGRILTTPELLAAQEAAGVEWATAFGEANRKYWDLSMADRDTFMSEFQQTHGRGMYIGWRLSYERLHRLASPPPPYNEPVTVPADDPSFSTDAVAAPQKPMKPA